MIEYALNKTEQKLLSDAKTAYYMQPTLDRIDRFVTANDSSPKAWQEVFNQIYAILSDAKDDVELILEQRKRSGKIKDIPQTRKSVAGNAFSKAIIYVFLQNKISGNIKPSIFITSKPSDVKGFDRIAAIDVGGETQKPDCDLIMFNEKADGSVDRCAILSLKTSLRERAGQTYRWKLLMEIGTTENPIKDKYDIVYKPEVMPLVCFATTNFYDEINSPQHRGMFKFFDKSFIAKPIEKDFVAPLSELVDFVNQTL